jgi:hypothetical protein
VLVSRKIVLSILIVTLLGVTGLCALTGYGLYRWVQRNRIGVNILRFENYTAQVTESQTYPLEQTAALEIASDFGDITVTAADVSDIQVDVLRAWGASQGSRRQRPGPGGGGAPTAYAPPQLPPARAGCHRRPGAACCADFTVRVPARIAVKLNAYQGEVFRWPAQPGRDTRPLRRVHSRSY